MIHRHSVVLGISYGHGDSSAAIIVDGTLVAAAEEERFVRRKHYALFPDRAIQYCMRAAGVTPEQIGIVAIAKQPLAALPHKAAIFLRNPKLLLRKKPKSDRMPSLRVALNQLGITRARVERVEHHRAHMFSARYLAPQERVAMLSIDGLGDFCSAAMAVADGDRQLMLQRIYFPHSLGFFYTAMTQFLGFPHHGDEFKVMGLSSYGEDRFKGPMKNLIRERKGGFALNLDAFPLLKAPPQISIENGQPKIRPFYNVPLITQMLGVQPRKSHLPIQDAHRDLAKSVQLRFEEIASHLLRHLHEQTGLDSVALAGGCAHNSVWAGKIREQTPFRNVYIAPAAHDAGIAVGAAIAAWGTRVVPQSGHWALLGPDDTQLNPTQTKRFTKTKEWKDPNDLAAWMATELSREKIIGLFHGRMEFGPRALGSRSILADPRSTTMRDRLNSRVKHREEFRPFAVSILAEHREDWFPESFECPTMEAVFPVPPARRKQIPSATHADGSCRIQSVSKETQPFYWQVIEAFHKATGVPMLINTSFNDSEPIVCSPEDALNCFQHTELDYLVLGNQVFSATSESRKQPMLDVEHRAVS